MLESKLQSMANTFVRVLRRHLFRRCLGQVRQPPFEVSPQNLEVASCHPKESHLRRADSEIWFFEWNCEELHESQKPLRTRRSPVRAEMNEKDLVVSP